MPVDAAGHEFALRMMEKPKPASLTSDPAARIFYDPPEIIQMAFGGRPWFHSTDCRAVHRIGLFLGLGWRLGEYVRKQLDGKHADIDTVQIKARAHNISRETPLYDMYFMQVVLPEDVLDPLQPRVIDHRAGLALDQLKPQYAEVLGEHAI